MRYLSEQQKLEIIEKYKTGKYLSTDLAREYGVKPPAISVLFKKRGVVINRVRAKTYHTYPYNQEYFSIIDSEEKAYWLGYLYADGSICSNKRRVDFRLAEQDKEILEKFNACVGSSKPLVKTAIRCHMPNRQDQYASSLCGKRMVDDLEKLGCMNNKTFKIQFPSEDQVPKHLIRHFIRGYCDGDGFIGCFYAPSTKKTRFSIYIVCTESFAFSLRKLLRDTLDIHVIICDKSGPEKKNKITKSASISTRYQTMKFLEWIYNDSTIFLQRKYRKYLSMWEHIDKNPLEYTDSVYSVRGNYVKQ